MGRRGLVHTGVLPQIVARVLRSLPYVQFSAGWLLEPDGTAEFWGTVGADALEVRKASGDPVVVFDIGGTDKFTVGVDDSDSDKFKINSGGSLADPSDLEMDSSGNVEVASDVRVGGGLNVGGLSDAVVDGAVRIVRGSGSDPQVVFDHDGNIKFVLGVDDTDSKFKIHSGGVLVSPSDFEVDSSGNVALGAALTVAGSVGFFGGAAAAQQTVAHGNADGEIGGLTIGAGYDQGEVQALRDKCEELADDVRSLRAGLVAYALVAEA